MRETLNKLDNWLSSEGNLREQAHRQEIHREKLWIGWRTWIMNLLAVIALNQGIEAYQNIRCEIAYGGLVDREVASAVRQNC